MSRQLNKIPKLEREVAIYLAGLIDGEGSFMISHSVYHGYDKYNARFRIGMSDKRTIEWVADKLNRKVQNHSLGRNASSNAKKIYRVSIEDCVSLVEFINQVIPYMVTKKQIANEIRAFCLTRIGVLNLPNKKRAYSKNNKDSYLKLKNLNRFGIGGEVN